MIAAKTEKTPIKISLKEKKISAYSMRSVQVNREAHAIYGKITIKMAVKIGK